MQAMGKQLLKSVCGNRLGIGRLVLGFTLAFVQMTGAMSAWLVLPGAWMKSLCPCFGADGHFWLLAVVGSTRKRDTKHWLA
jgi:hypothetical protein